MDVFNPRILNNLSIIGPVDVRVYRTSGRARDIFLLALVSSVAICILFSFLLGGFVFFIFDFNVNGVPDAFTWIASLLIGGAVFGLIITPAVFFIAYLFFKLFATVEFTYEGIKCGSLGSFIIPYNSILDVWIVYPEGMLEKIKMDSKSLGALPSKAVIVELTHVDFLPLKIRWACRKDSCVVLDVHDPEHFKSKLDTILISRNFSIPVTFMGAAPLE